MPRSIVRSAARFTAPSEPSEVSILNFTAGRFATKASTSAWTCGSAASPPPIAYVLLSASRAGVGAPHAATIAARTIHWDVRNTPARIAAAPRQESFRPVARDAQRLVAPLTESSLMRDWQAPAGWRLVLALDERVDVPGVGRVRYDLAFGGAFYAYVDAADLGLALDAAHYRALIDAGSRIKRAVMAAREVRHPFEPELSFLYGTIFTGPPLGDDAHSRNVCVFAEGEVDRSPTGTGVSARLAIEHARGRVGVAEAFAVESIIGTRFVGRVARTARFGPHDAVVPEVEGSAWITGRSELLFAPDDPLAGGFILR